MVRLACLSATVLLAAILAVPAYAGGPDTPDESSAVIATGDFNRDGIPDLVEASSSDGDDASPHSLTVLLGQRDGTFRSVGSPIPIGADPRALVVGDFNGDGNLDVILGESNGTLRQFLGDGKGNLIDAGNVATLGSVTSMAVGQFTRDGHLDLVVSDFSSNSAVILLGSGNGSFERVWAFQLPRKGREFTIATADVNRDGITDLVIASDDDEDYEVMLGNGNGTFTYSPALSHLRDPNSYCPS